SSHQPHRHSFPTRRSSDLAWKEAKVGMSKKNEENEQHENIDEADLVTEDEKIDTTMDEDADMMTNVRNLSGWVRYVFMTIAVIRSEEHTSELQSRFDLVCR